ncbi:MAG: VWA domain-containing protein [Candidatus Omnitrophota bacterium]|nr:VWA domain-containing protein [Candidatus Omnitrophota bacterium]
MKFGAPYVFILLWLIPGIIVFYIIRERNKEKVMRLFADKEPLAEISKSYNPQRTKIKKTIIVMALFFLIIALARPQWGFQWQEVKRKGVDILIALDTSKSMLAEDVLPNRLLRAKLAIKDLVKKIRGDRIGLIVFSGTAFLQCPLTIDYDGFLLALDDVDVQTIPVGGTSLSQAIYAAISAYESEKKDDKVLIIITDGEDLEGGIDKAVETAKAKDIKIFCVGIGSQKGELVPVKDSSGKINFLKDSEGNIVKTKLMENILQNMAIRTGGMYVRAGRTEFGLDLIYEEKLSKMDKQEFKSKMEKRFYERFQLPLVFAILLLLVEPMISERKREEKNGKT